MGLGLMLALVPFSTGPNSPSTRVAFQSSPSPDERVSSDVPRKSDLTDDDDDNAANDEFTASGSERIAFARMRTDAPWSDYVHFALIDHLTDPELPPPRG